MSVTLAEIVAIFLILASYLFGTAMLILVVVYLKHQEPDKSYIWTLPRALSEKVEGVPATDPAAYAPSASRLIAFMGMGIIMILFLGVGAISIWGFMTRQTLPDLDKIGWFLGAGASMFVPYAANKIADAMKALRSDGTSAKPATPPPKKHDKPEE